MSEDTWEPARLIPTSGIRGGDEQERRATSALLAVMAAVRQFGRALTGPLGAPAGRMETFVEVPFVLGDAEVVPDGLIRVRHGRRTWTALVEVKTDTRQLTTTQVEAYLDVAEEQGFDALVTLSNDIPAAAGEHPVAVDPRRLRRVALHHWSWSQVLAEAVMQKDHRRVPDREEDWILGELIRYLRHPRSGAQEFDDMGPFWVAVREAVPAGILRPGDPGAGQVVARFDALLQYAALRLGQQLGIAVVAALSRRELTDPAQRTAEEAAELVSSGVLRGALRIPGTVGPLVVTADLRSNRVTCHVDVDAPRQGRPTTRVNWLVRQLAAAPETARVEASFAHARGPGPVKLLTVLREDPGRLVAEDGRELRSFRIALSGRSGGSRGRGRDSFIDSVLNAIDMFHEEVLRHLRAWQPAATRPRAAPAPIEEAGTAVG